MADTPNLGLPLLAAAQSQKHVTHNEALEELDGLVQCSVISRTLTSPPGSPADSREYLQRPPEPWLSGTHLAGPVPETVRAGEVR